MARKKFWRKDTLKILRLGRKRKKQRKWRRAKGRHSKIRLKRRGYLAAPEIGYKKPTTALKPKIIYSAEELKKMTANETVLVGKVGKKKKIEIAKAALENKIKLLNLNAKKFLKKVEKEKAEEKKKTEKKPEPEPEAEKKEKVEEKKPEEEAKKEKAEEKKIEKKAKALREEKETKVEKIKFKEKQPMFRKALEK